MAQSARPSDRPWPIGRIASAARALLILLILGSLFIGAMRAASASTDELDLAQEVALWKKSVREQRRWERPRPGEQFPDLVALPPRDIAMEITDGRHLLRFTQAFANMGTGPLLVRGLDDGSGSEAMDMHGVQEILDASGEVSRTHPIPSVLFHPHHEHWHAGDIAAYELRQGSPSGSVVAKNGKISFCLVDNYPASGYKGPYQPSGYFDCKQPYQGLTAGWVDEYEASLPDQWVDVTRVPDGIYFLVVRGDPDRVYLELDRTNNVVWVKVELSNGGQQVRVLEEG